MGQVDKPIETYEVYGKATDYGDQYTDFPSIHIRELRMSYERYSSPSRRLK